MALDLDDWLRRYGDAWAARDGDAAASLFSEDAAYCWGPFAEPLVGHVAIRDRWNAATADLEDVRFRAEAIGRDGARRFVRWRVELREPGQASVALDGVFVLDFADDGRCSRLQEWWMVRP